MSTSHSNCVWHKILVPTDFSQCSLAALRSAARMWENLHLEVVLLHVTEPVHEGLRIQTEDLHEKMRIAAKKQLQELAEKYFPGAGEKISLKLEEGRAAEKICLIAAEEKADAIIIPTHGHSGLKHMLVGSVAEKVVRQAGCDVLVVRPT